MSNEPSVYNTLWAKLRASTPARIGLPRSGVSIATSAHLAFQLAHAQARDAVHEELNASSMVRLLQEFGDGAFELHSRASDRAEYLLRPDLGRTLDEASSVKLKEAFVEASDICFVVADGLSARAIETSAMSFLRLAIPNLQAAGWRIGRTSVVSQARVAVGDEIGQICRAALVALLIGERPGLSAADSMGIYLTWSPKPGRMDAERNCLSNIRPGGMSCEEAVYRLCYLCNQARALRMTGVNLKDASDLQERATAELPTSPTPDQYLT